MTHALIIDDDIKNLTVLQQMLSHQGITHTSVQDSTQVEIVLEDLDTVDIIFLDLEMPEIDGYQLFELFQQYPKLANTRIIACTVHTAELHTAQNMGFHSFISKPLNIHRFPEQVNNILDGIAVWDAR